MEAWISAVRSAAAAGFGGEPAKEPISMEIWYFHLENSIDLDNLAKPICDALKKLVYEDEGR